jgi:Ca2+-binding RTX toxin-like protein
VLLANDSDADHDALSITGVSNVSNAIVDIVNGALRIFTLAQHAGFDYTISDGQGGTDTGHVAIDTIGFLLPIRGMVDAGVYDAADLSGGLGIDTLRGSPGDDRLNGGVGADTLEGRGGDDVINGGRGADVITGGLGADILTGGLGADRFVYTALADFAAGEAITDFARGDRIDLRAIDANAGVGGNQAFAFIGLGAFTGVAGQLHYALTTGGAVLSGDVDGDAVADFSLFLAGVSTLREGDFIL